MLLFGILKYTFNYVFGILCPMFLLLIQKSCFMEMGWQLSNPAYLLLCMKFHLAIIPFVRTAWCACTHAILTNNKLASSANQLTPQLKKCVCKNGWICDVRMEVPSSLTVDNQNEEHYLLRNTYPSHHKQKNMLWDLPKTTLMCCYYLFL